MPPPLDPYAPLAERAARNALPPLAGLNVDGNAALQQAHDFVNQVLADSAPRPAAPPPPAEPDIGYSADGSKIYVQGHVFDSDDADSIVRAQALLNQPGTGRLPNGFERLDRAGYDGLVGQIKAPSGWGLLKKAFGTNVDVAQQNFGRAAQAANEAFLPEGQTGWGAGIANRNAEEIRKKAPYDRSGPDASWGDYLITTVGGAVPSILGSAAAGVAGGIAGSATMGPGIGTAIGAFGGAMAYNYPQAVGDIAGRQLEVNGKIDPGAAFANAVPYAALDSATEVVGGLGVLGKLGKAGKVGLKPIVGRGFGRGVGEVGKRLVLGAAGGAIAEGPTEAGQQYFVRRGAGQELWSQEAKDEYWQSGVAGATVGAVFGAGGRLITRAPAQDGEPLTSAPADVLNKPSQRPPSPPQQQRLLGAPGVRGWQDRPGSYLGDESDGIEDAIWEPVPGETQIAGLLPFNPTHGVIDPQGRVYPGSVAGAAKRTSPTQEKYGPATGRDLFGEPLYTDPASIPSTVPAGVREHPAVGAFPSAAFEGTPLGQQITGDQMSEGYSPTLFPPQIEEAAAAVADRRDTGHGATALAGETAFDEITHFGAPVGVSGINPQLGALEGQYGIERPGSGVADFRPKSLALKRGLQAGRVPTQTELKDALAIAEPHMPKGMRNKLIMRINLTKDREKIAKIAEDIAAYTPGPGAAHQLGEAREAVLYRRYAGLPRSTPEAANVKIAGHLAKKEYDKAEALIAKHEKPTMAFGTSGMKLKKGKGKLTQAGLGDRLHAARGAMLPTEVSGLTVALRAAGTDETKLAAVAKRLDQIEAEIEADTPVEVGTPPKETPVAPGAARLRRSGPQPTNLIQLNAGEPFVFVGTKTQPMPHDPAAHAAITKELDDLPETADEYTVMAAHKYLEDNNYANASALVEGLKKGREIGRFAMTPEEYEAQKAKQNYRREQKSANADVEGGITLEMALLRGAINFLGTGYSGHGPKLTKSQFEYLQKLANGNNDYEAVHAAVVEAVRLKSGNKTATVMEGALREAANRERQAAAEAGGESGPATSPIHAAIDEAIEALLNAYPTAKREAAAKAAAAAVKTIPADEAASHLTHPEKVAISKVYGQDGFWTDEAQGRFIQDFTDYIDGKLRGIHAIVKAAIKRINAAVMAVAMVFNPAALSNVSPDFISTHIEQTAQAAEITPAPVGVEMSEMATLAYTRLSSMARGRGLIIVDKPTGQIYFFDAKGQIITSGPVLTGISKGDFLPESRMKGTLPGGGLTSAQVDAIPESDRITPSGVFTTKAYVSHVAGNALRLNNAQGQNFGVAIHDTYIKDRLPRFKTNSAGDNMVSYGCVNISPEMFDATLKNDIDKFNNNLVFVIPHDISKAAALLPAAEAEVAQKEQRQQEVPLAPPKQDAPLAPPLRDEDDYVGQPDQPGARAASRPSPVFSREDTAAFVGDGMSHGDVEAELQAATKNWRAAPQIKVHKDWASIPDEYKKRLSKTAKGFFDRTTGVVHIIAAHMADASDVRSTLYHEALGHFGLWNRFTQRLGPMLTKMYHTNKAVKTEADKYLNFRDLEATPANIALAVEETLAEWFSPGAVKLSAWQQIKAYVRNMGRTMGMSVEYSDNDIASVMHKAQQYTMRSDGPITLMEHNDATGPDILMRDWGVADMQSKSPPWLRDLGTGRWTAFRDAFSGGAIHGMLGNQLAEDYLPSLGVSKAKRVAAMVRNRLATANIMMNAPREWTAAVEEQPLSWRGRSKGIGKPDINNLSGYLETGRRRGKWGFFPEDGRFPEDDIESAKERFYRGKVSAANDKFTEEPLYDPEMAAAFDAMTPKQQQLIRDYYFMVWSARDQERSSFFETLNKTYGGEAKGGAEAYGPIGDAKAALDEAEYYAGIQQERAKSEDATALDKSMAKKKTKEYDAAKVKYDTLVKEKAKAARELHNTYRDIEYVPYASTQRHGAFVIIAESKVLQAARAAKRAADEAGVPYEAPEGQKSIYAMEADEDHYFVHAVDNRLDAVRMVQELHDKAPEFSGGRIAYGKVAEVGESLFEGSDVIAGLQKIMGNTDVSGETQATNNIVLEIAKRAIIDALSQNSARKADKHFRNIRSAPLDMPKAFMSRMLSSSQFLSGHEHNDKIHRAMADALAQIDDPRYVSAKNRAKAKAGMLEFIARYNDDMTPHATDTLADVLTTASAVKMLILSPSYYVQQLAQNMLITAPHLTQWFGPKDIGSAFKIGYEQVHKAFSDTGGGSAGKGVLKYLSNGMLDISQIDPQYREMLRFLENQGLLDVSMNLEMGRVSSDASATRMDKFMRGVRNSVRGLESNNRIAAGIAAFHLMHAEGRVTSETISNLLGVDQKAFDQRYEDYVANHTTMKKYADHSKEELGRALTKDEFAAAEFARQVILNTHGDYSSSNKPPWTRRGLGRVATQFRTFNVMMIGTFIKTLRASFDFAKTKEDRAMARRAMMYMVGNTALFAGLNGLPLMGLLGWAYGVLLAGDDEPDRDYQKDIREWTGDATIANLILYGAPSLAGINMSGSIGMGNMFSPVSGKDAPTDPEKANAYAIALMLGPSASLVNSTADAIDLYFNKGQTYKALAAVVPKALLGPMQAAHDASVGEYTRNGIQTMRPEDISILETAWGVFGIQSADRSARKWSIGRAIDEEQFFSSTGASIKRDHIEAKAAGDSARMAESRENWMALQAARARFGLKQQPISQLGSALKKASTDSKNVYAGIPYTGSTKGQALKLGQLAGQ